MTCPKKAIKLLANLAQDLGQATSYLSRVGISGKSLKPLEKMDFKENFTCWNLVDQEIEDTWSLDEAVQ